MDYLLPFDLKQLHYAVVAAEHRSFRQAALAIGVETTVFSRRIRDMEYRLGVRLFERSRTGATPTAHGIEFLRRARRIVEEAKLLTATAKAVSRGEAGRFVIGFYSSLSAGNLRATVLDFAERHPNVEIEGVEDNRSRLFEGLDWDAIDLAVVTGDVRIEPWAMRSLWSERVMVALPEHHDLITRDVIYWTDLRQETFLLPDHDPGSEIESLLIRKLSSPGYQPHILRHGISRENVLSVVGAAGSLTIVCEGSLGTQYPNVVLREIHDPSGPARISYSGYWRKDNKSPALQQFLNLVTKRYSLPT